MRNQKNSLQLAISQKIAMIGYRVILFCLFHSWPWCVLKQGFIHQIHDPSCGPQSWVKKITTHTFAGFPQPKWMAAAQGKGNVCPFLRWDKRVGVRVGDLQADDRFSVQGVGMGDGVSWASVRGVCFFQGGFFFFFLRNRFGRGIVAKSLAIGFGGFYQH